MTYSDFVEALKKGQKTFTNVYFTDNVYITSDLENKFMKENCYHNLDGLTFDHCEFRHSLKIDNYSMIYLVIDWCNIRRLIINNANINKSHVDTTDITDIHISNSHILKSYIAINIIQRSYIYNTCMFNNKLDVVLEYETYIDKCKFQCNDINVRRAFRIYARKAPRLSPILNSVFSDNIIIDSTINDLYLYNCDFDSNNSITHSYFSRMKTYNTNILDFVSNICPKEGSFIGYKIVAYDVIFSEGIESIKIIAVLEIPEDTKRSSAFSNKCRASKAKVLWFEDTEGNILSEISEARSVYSNWPTLYKVGEMVYPYSFDENPLNECSEGIHFYMHRNDCYQAMNKSKRSRRNVYKNH